MRTYDVPKVKIQEKKMVRDMKNKALLSTDIEGLRAYKDRKKSMETINLAVDEIGGIKQEINTMKEDLSIIKDLLMKALNDSK